MDTVLEPFRHGSMAGLAIIAGAAALTGLLIVWLRPWLIRYAMARPNARSSHKIPTPQGGGIAIVTSWIIIAAGAMVAGGAVAPQMAFHLAVVMGASAVIAVLGAIDDIRPIDVVPRLLIQILAVAAVVATIPADLQVTSFLPLWLERAVLVLGGVWFVNLVNFMDGLDWMTVAEMAPLTAGLALLFWLTDLPAYGVICALALLGALIGFAPFNRPVARLFLGDVGSLPIGLITGWLLLLLAGNGHLAAALLLPLYYLADATITLFRRLAKGERVWQAHRSHFYQRATDNGFSVREVVGHVFAVNLVLVALATLTVEVSTLPVQIAAPVAGSGLVAWLLVRFSRKRS